MSVRPETRKFSNTSQETEISANGIVAIRYTPLPGEDIDVGKNVAEHHRRRTTFNMSFIDFGQSLNHLSNSIIPVSERMTSDSTELEILGFTQPTEVDGLFRRIAEIAQDDPEVIIRKGLHVEFRDILRLAVERLHGRTEWLATDGVLVPLRGGALIANLLPIDMNTIIPIDSKRVPLVGGGLGLGMGLPGSDQTSDTIKLFEWMERRLEALDGKRITILEAAVASGLTTAGYLMEFYSRNIIPQHIEIIAPVVSQQGAELTLSVARALGMKVTIRGAKMFYNLGDLWGSTEDSLKDDNGNFVIGKATETLESFLQVERFIPRVENGGTDIIFDNK